RQTTDVARWPSIERYVRIGFWGSNIGLALMVILSLFPAGVLQVWDVLQHGYWHARSIAYTGSNIARQLEWMRLPADLIFIIFGAIPLMIAALKAYWGLYIRPLDSLQIKLPPPH
ncbi:MAG: nitric-oxide reductase large subunit, partial [bacterium]|nr:nitric-oxide reductase large subunit [bacterium]